MGIIITRPHHEKIEGPLVYLLGPIRGVDWQSEAMGLLSINPALHIASPRSSSLEEGDQESSHEWEKEYMIKALARGTILLWLPRESGMSPEVLMNFYTLGGLGVKGDRMVFGIEEGFPYKEKVVETFSLQWGTTIFSSLPETCNEAIRLCGMV